MKSYLFESGYRNAALRNKYADYAKAGYLQFEAGFFNLFGEKKRLPEDYAFATGEKHVRKLCPLIRRKSAVILPQTAVVLILKKDNGAVSVYCSSGKSFLKLPVGEPVDAEIFSSGLFQPSELKKYVQIRNRDNTYGLYHVSFSDNIDSGFSRVFDGAQSVICVPSFASDKFCVVKTASGTDFRSYLLMPGHFIVLPAVVSAGIVYLSGCDCGVLSGIFKTAGGFYRVGQYSAADGLVFTEDSPSFKDLKPYVYVIRNKLPYGICKNPELHRLFYLGSLDGEKYALFQPVRNSLSQLTPYNPLLKELNNSDWDRIVVDSRYARDYYIFRHRNTGRTIYLLALSRNRPQEKVQPYFELMKET